MSAVAQQSPEAGPAARVRWPALSAAGWLLLLGLVLRTGHYLWNHTIWYDESVLLVNVLAKDCAGLLGPLDHEVAAPPLFLWSLRAMALAFGDHPYVWRFPPFVISCLTLLLMSALARRLLRPGPAVLLVGLVAFSDAFVWLGCNVKPYILDAFLAACLLYAYARTADWTLARRMIVFAIAAPALLCVSYPMIFLYGGLMLAFLAPVWRARRASSWAIYCCLGVAVLLTFACLYFGPMKAQRVSGLVDGWKNKFPNLEHPAAVPGWVVGNNFLVFHYCYNPIGAGCVFFAIAGVWWCLRNRRLDWACLCLGPLAGCLLAAFARAYPYSSNRLMLFAAPGIGLITALGATAVLEWLRGRTRWAMAGLVAVLLLPEAAVCLMHIHSPWLRPDAAGVTEFVNEHRRSDDLIASDEGNYLYFFFGQVHSLADAAGTNGKPGQRVWVLIDHRTPEFRRTYSRVWMASPEWELQSESLFRQASAFLFVRREKEVKAGRDNHPRSSGG